MRAQKRAFDESIQAVIDVLNKAEQEVGPYLRPSVIHNKYLELAKSTGEKKVMILTDRAVEYRMWLANARMVNSGSRPEDIDKVNGILKKIEAEIVRLGRTRP